MSENDKQNVTNNEEKFKKMSEEELRNQLRKQMNPLRKILDEQSKESAGEDEER